MSSVYSVAKIQSKITFSANNYKFFKKKTQNVESFFFLSGIPDLLEIFSLGSDLFARDLTDSPALITVMS